MRHVILDERTPCPRLAADVQRVTIMTMGRYEIGCRCGLRRRDKQVLRQGCSHTEGKASCWRRYTFTVLSAELSSESRAAHAPAFPAHITSFAASEGSSCQNPLPLRATIHGEPLSRGKPLVSSAAQAHRRAIVAQAPTSLCRARPSP